MARDSLKLAADRIAPLTAEHANYLFDRIRALEAALEAALKAARCPTSDECPGASDQAVLDTTELLSSK